MKIKSSKRMGRVMFLTVPEAGLPHPFRGGWGGPQIDYQNAGEKSFVAMPV